METALDPFRDEPIDVAQFVARYGRKTPGSVRPSARCPACAQPLNVVGDATPNTVGHFAHRKNSPACHVKEFGQLRYLDLLPTDPDPARGVWLRAEVLQHTDWCLALIQRWVPFLSGEELDESLAHASARKLWEYRHLQPWQVPYCLLMTREWPPWSGLREPDGTPRRQLWFRFWFDARVRSIDDLWIRGGHGVSIHRGTYRLPATGPGLLPGPRELLRLRSVLLDVDAQGKSELRGGESSLRELRSIMARHLA